MAGGAAAGWASKHIGSFAINSLGVAGKSAIGGFVTGAIGGATAGASGGFVTGLATGGWDKAWEMAGQGAIYGGIAGGVLGGYRGFKSARATGSNPWTGQARTNELTKTFDLDGTLNRINRGESYPHRNDGSTFRNKEGFLPESPNLDKPEPNRESCIFTEWNY